MQCFEDLGKPVVTFDTFWDVYCELRNRVEVAVPGDVVVAIGESFRDDTGGSLELPGSSESFALAHMKEPVLGGIGVDENEEEDGGGLVLCIDFTNEEDMDQ